MIYAMIMKLKKTSLRYVTEIHLHAVRQKRACNRLHSNRFKINKRLSWKITGDLVFTKYTERRNETYSTDISPHGLQAGFCCSCALNKFWLLKATLEWQFLHAGCLTWTSEVSSLHRWCLLCEVQHSLHGQQSKTCEPNSVTVSLLK